MTLVEWMVSITIGLILLAGLTGLIARQSSAQSELEKSSRQIENGRYAMQLLNEDVQMAGYYGEFSNVGSLAVPSALPDPCVVTVSAIEAAMARRPARCQPASRLPTTWRVPTSWSCGASSLRR